VPRIGMGLVGPGFVGAHHAVWTKVREYVMA
jgi:hypothetical protein